MERKPTTTSLGIRKTAVQLAALLFLFAIPALAQSAKKKPPTLEERLRAIRLGPQARFPVRTTHFTVEGYRTDIEEIGRRAESAVTEFINVTGLPSFSPTPIRIIVLADRNEFLQKARPPHGQTVVAAGDTIVTFPHAQLEHAVESQTAALLTEQAMSRDQRPELRWLSQGLGEFVAYTLGGRDPHESRESWRRRIVQSGPPTEDAFSGRSERGANATVVRLARISLLSFLMEWDGRLNLGYLVQRLGEGRSLDDAVALSYPGKFRSFSELYAFWLDREIGPVKKPVRNRK